MSSPRYLLFFSLLGLIVTLDQFSTFVITISFSLHETLPLIDGFFSLTLVRNAGAAFGLLASVHDSFREPFLLVIPCTILMVLVYFYHRATTSQPLSLNGTTIIIAGAIGNLLDRARLG